MKIALFILPIIILGVVFGLATTGKINIPGISPKPKKVAKKGPDVKVDEKKVEEPKHEIAKPKQPDPPQKPKKDEPKPDLAKGDKAVAAVWAEIPTPQLIKIVGKWKDAELARVLFRMESDKVAELLGQLAEDRASKLSREIQKLASAPPVAAAS